MGKIESYCLGGAKGYWVGFKEPKKFAVKKSLAKSTKKEKERRGGEEEGSREER